jgi:hypothetical protein
MTTSSNPPPSAGWSVGTWLATSLIITLIGLLSLGTVLYLTVIRKRHAETQLADLRQQQAIAEVQQLKAAEQAKLALARTHQEQVLTQARGATNLLERLRRETDVLATRAAELRTNALGQRVALHPELVALARRLYERNLPACAPQTEILPRLEGARRIIAQLTAALGTLYEPETELAATVQAIHGWSEQGLRQVAEADAFLTMLGQEAGAKVLEDPASPAPVSLQAALEQTAQAASVVRQRTIQGQATQAQGEADLLVAKAEARRVIEEAQLQASNILAQAELVQRRLERDAILAQAQSKLEQSEYEGKVKAIESELLKKQYIKLASDPRIQAQLAPFITRGYYLPSQASLTYAPRSRPTTARGFAANTTPSTSGSSSYELLPHSFARLQSLGALTPTVEGLRALVSIASDPRDKVRPRWSLVSDWSDRVDEMEYIKSVQQRLIQMGPVLVELKLLAP